MIVTIKDWVTEEESAKDIIVHLVDIHNILRQR